jgi:alkyl hydroperoxide reductase subunit AhpC
VPGKVRAVATATLHRRTRARRLVRLVADFNVSKLYGMLPASTSGDPAPQTPADNQTVRNVFVIGAGKRVKLISVYPMTTRRIFDDFLQVIDSLRLTPSTASQPR